MERRLNRALEIPSRYPISAGKCGGTYEYTAVAAVPNVLGQATCACDAVFSPSLYDMLFYADQIETSAFPGHLTIFCARGVGNLICKANRGWEVE